MSDITAEDLNLACIMKMRAKQSSELPVGAITQSEWENNISNKMRLFQASILYGQGKRRDAYNILAQLRRESPAYGTGEYFFRRLSLELRTT